MVYGVGYEVEGRGDDRHGQPRTFLSTTSPPNPCPQALKRRHTSSVDFRGLCLYFCSLWLSIFFHSFASLFFLDIMVRIQTGGRSRSRLMGDENKEAFMESHMVCLGQETNSSFHVFYTVGGKTGGSFSTL